MKLGITLIVLGILGIAQYIYFFNPREWYFGIVGAIIGIGLLTWGIIRRKEASK